jgi:hypothetical protein
VTRVDVVRVAAGGRAIWIWWDLLLYVHRLVKLSILLTDRVLYDAINL